MKNAVITGSGHILYQPFKELYSASFPLFEQRTASQQEYAFGHNGYRLIGYYDTSCFIGFVSYWEFDTYIYVEHLAVDPTIRGRGYGSEMLRSFIGSTDKIILLEIDPITDHRSEARWRFYDRCGFYRNTYPHRHPPYRDGYEPHPLIVLTSRRQISGQEYDTFYRDLDTIVMNNNL